MTKLAEVVMVVAINEKFTTNDKWFSKFVIAYLLVRNKPLYVDQNI